MICCLLAAFIFYYEKEARASLGFGEFWGFGVVLGFGKIGWVFWSGLVDVVWELRCIDGYGSGVV